jgi:hypothetical protein
MKLTNNKPEILPFQQAFVPSYFVGLFLKLLFGTFTCKNSTFCDQDPDPHGSALVLLPDPDQH